MKSNAEESRVLIVDDEPDLREFLSGLLETLHIKTTQAASGEEALDLLRTGTYHAVLCDIRMTGMSGIDCLKVALSEGITAPFVFMTAFSDISLIKQAVRLGALDFTEKPFDNEELTDIVHRAVYVGIRRHRILNAIESESPALLAEVKKTEKMVSQMRAFSHVKRAAK